MSPAPSPTDSTAPPEPHSSESPYSSYSIHALRVELHRRGLSPHGLRDDLLARLQTQTLPLSVPQSFPAPSHPLLLQPPPRVVGILKHRTVWITGDSNTTRFYQRTSLGKASLSRSAPTYNPDISAVPLAYRGRAMRQLHALEADVGDVDASRVDVEHLQLTLVEAFYAAFVDHALLIRDAARTWESCTKTWRLFCRRSPTFATHFVAYYRYRCAGWMPRSGLKYGVDWVLYPASNKKHSHSPFCVMLIDGTSTPAKVAKNWIALQNHLRLVKNVAKTLVVASISLKDQACDPNKSMRDAFRSVSIHELTVDRWLP